MNTKTLSNSTFPIDIERRLIIKNDKKYFDFINPNKTMKELTNDLTNLTLVSVLPPPLNIVGNLLNAVYL